MVAAVGGRDRGSACVRGADADTRPGVGTSATAKIPNACGWSGVGRPLDARPSGVRRRRLKPGTPRISGRGGGVPSPRHNPRKNPSSNGAWSRRRASRSSSAWSRSKNFFSIPLCDRPGCYEPPPKSGRNQAKYCCRDCRQAVRRVLDRERKWLKRGTFQGHCNREREYQATRARHSGAAPNSASASSPGTQPP